MELDDADIEYLNDNQIIYVSFDGKKFIFIIIKKFCSDY
jgi:hypothetical protein